MREGEHTGEYLWLRQTVTITANGQTRTLEMAIPVRPGATPEEIAALRAQATAGMAQLSRALDDAVAAAFADVVQLQPATASLAVEHAIPNSSLSQATSTPAIPAPTSPVAATLPSAQPAATSRESPSPLLRPGTEPPAQGAASVAPSAPAASTTASASAAPTPPSRPASSPAPPPAPIPAATHPASTSAAVSGAPMSRQEFLSAASQLGLNPKQAMERLGVRTLEGLNLREALEALRRQMVRGENGEAPAQSPVPASAAPSASNAGMVSSNPSRTPSGPSARSAPVGQSNSLANARPAGGLASPTPRATPASTSAAPHFDEEIDAEFEYHISDEGFRDEFGEDVADDPDTADAQGAPGHGAYAEAGYPSQAAAAADFGDLDDLAGFGDEDDVPDFSAGTSHSSATRPAPPASRGAASSRAAATPASPAPRPTAPNTHDTHKGAPGEATGADNNTQLRAVELIKRMRGAPSGGSLGEREVDAYRNVVVQQLTESEARMLVQGLWRVPPERLGADQLEALLSWGKRDDDFADNARLVLAELAAERKAERERAMGAASSADAPTNGRAAPSPPSSPASPRSRARTTKRDSDEPADG